MRRRAVAALVAVLALASACGVPATGITEVGPLPRAEGPAVNNTVYFLKGGKLMPVVRPGLPGAPLMPLRQLGHGVTDNERRMGFTSTLPGVGIVTGLPDPSVHDVGPAGAQTQTTPEIGESDKVTVALETTIPPAQWPRVWQAQIACTAEAIPGVEKVELNIFDGRPGREVRCADYRDLLGTSVRN
ncbi:hypothetical protein [Actinomadura logoneensis]|uniref:hypothetical protein n=1 Tax=Actinomadura logoneensis TaxID=2293572 RepID=UPI001314D999|nr:hypothetical protein [Actinomadura logoneensis]